MQSHGACHDLHIHSDERCDCQQPGLVGSVCFCPTTAGQGGLGRVSAHRIFSKCGGEPGNFLLWVWTTVKSSKPSWKRHWIEDSPYLEEAEHRSRKKDLRRLPWLSCVDSASTAGGLGLIPGQGTRAHILQLKKKTQNPHAASRTWHSQKK